MNLFQGHMGVQYNCKNCVFLFKLCMFVKYKIMYKLLFFSWALMYNVGDVIYIFQDSAKKI